MRIVFLNQKGGVGKTTMAMLIGSSLKAAGCNVAFEDNDPQKSLTWWANKIGDTALISDNPNADIIIVDTAGHLDLENLNTRRYIGKIIGESQRIILVSEMSPFSMHASTAMATLIREEIKSGSKAYVLFNKIRSNTIIGKQSINELAKQLQLNTLKNNVPLSSMYEQISALGWSVISHKEREPIINLALEIIK